MKAKIIKDKETGFYTCFLDRVELGGPIISAETVEKVKEEFLEAWRLCYAVACLLRYSTHQDFKVFDSIEDSPLPQEIEFVEPILFIDTGIITL